MRWGCSPGLLVALLTQGLVWAKRAEEPDFCIYPPRIVKVLGVQRLLFRFHVCAFVCVRVCVHGATQHGAAGLRITPSLRQQQLVHNGCRPS